MPVNTSGIYIPKRIKDATANSSDVLSGKVFYNNNGRQVGSYREKVYGDFVKDATATTNDVASGKIFYNNAGRQTGRYEKPSNILKSYHINIPEMSKSSVTTEYYMMCRFSDGDMIPQTYRVMGQWQTFYINDLRCIAGYELKSPQTLLLCYDDIFNENFAETHNGQYYGLGIRDITAQFQYLPSYDDSVITETYDYAYWLLQSSQGKLTVNISWANFGFSSNIRQYTITAPSLDVTIYYLTI